MPTAPSTIICHASITADVCVIVNVENGLGGIDNLPYYHDAYDDRVALFIVDLLLIVVQGKGFEREYPVFGVMER
jgi:hypothetical protein